MKSLILFLSLALLFGSCSWFQKSEDNEPLFKPPVVTELPPETQTGANTFGCNINGKPWVPYGVNAFKADRTTYNIFLKATWEYNSDSEGITFNIHTPFPKEGNYSLYFPTSESGIARYHNIRSDGSAYAYYTDSLHKGMLTITRLDTIKRIISGRFHFTALKKENGDTVRITNGRFDKVY